MVRGSQKPRYTRSQVQRAIGEVVEEAREAAGLSQRELSERIDRSHGFIWHVEKGTSKLQIYELCRIADALDTSPSELLSRFERKL
jgi:transcriptional regulator with XRE-family HTH domain